MTTAIIFPLMSRTVPCNTSSGIEWQRLPPVQLELGPTLPTLRITLWNGSLRPFWPTGLAGGFFSVTGAALSPAFGGGVLLVTTVTLAAGGVLLVTWVAL